MSDFATMMENGRTNTPLPVSTSTPAVTGSAKCGQDLTVTNGNWNNMGSGIATSYSYQWRAAAVAIPSGNKQIYTPKTADVGKAVDCIVTARNMAGATAAAASNSVTITAS